MNSLVWFELPTDDVERARSFYEGLFGWKIQPIPELPDYWHIDTGGPDDSPDGGLFRRSAGNRAGATNYLSVESVEEYAAKVQRLGGVIRSPKTAIPGMGYYAMCEDPDGNVFGIWERDENAE